MDKIIIIGGRGTPTIAAEQFYDAKIRFGMPIEILGFALDDNSMGNHINGFPILCGIKELYEKYGKYDDVKYSYLLYRPDMMEKWSKFLYSLKIPVEKFANLVHPSAMVAKSVKMGYGNTILANVVVNSNVVMGNFNTINSLSLIAHDSLMGNNNYLAGNVSIGSGISIGSMNFIGLNSTIRNGITIGDTCIVGMASNVVKSLESHSIAYGNPAQSKEKLNNIIR